MLAIKLYTVAMLGLISGLCQAANPDMCFWWINKDDTASREYSLTITPTLASSVVPVGGILATTSGSFPINNSISMKCPSETVASIDETWSVEGAELAEGFTDVYQTGLKGIGIRLKNGYLDLPYSGSYVNQPARVSPIAARVSISFVRTGRDVEYGQAQIDLRVKIKLHRWDAATLTIQGKPIITGQNYFSGCSSVKSMHVAMGKIATVHLGKVPAKRFDLDILCSGMPMGSKPPVKIYFEGDSPGPGRLNLTPGGAQGIELRLLQGETNRLLPFYKNSALNMIWQSSQPGGELYRIPLSAEYVIPYGQKPVAGIANATLNYILEYN